MNWNEFKDQIYPPGHKRRSYLGRHLDISRRTDRYLNFVFGWLKRIPLVGELAFVFWTAPLSHDMEHYVWIRPFEVFHPYGALGFSYLNDGMHPTLWHTFQSLRNNKEYDGIWVPRAPRNKADAEAIRAFYAKRNGLAFTGGPAAILTKDES